ncbi:MAG: ABC transporter substrate-binding protein [Alicyclobacillus sp.]|nr:ABC transporter substrate-binding protein [Alicyclobacillus sp.]
MNWKRKWARGCAVASTVALLLGGFSAAPASAKVDSSPPVKIMVGGMTKIIYLPAELTARLGYFKQEGVNVQLLDETAGVSAEDELVSGQVDGVVGFYDHVIDLQSKGKSLIDVATFFSNPGERLVVSNREKGTIKSIRDLAGKRIGVTDLGSSTNFLATYLVVKGGHSPTSYTPVPVGAGQTLIAAMQHNQIDAAVTTEPTVSLLEKKHMAFVLVSMATAADATKTLGGTYPAACLYMRTDYVKAHPDVVQKLVNAFVKTMQYIHTHTPEQIADQLPADYYAGDKQMYLLALTRSMGMFTPDGRMPANGPKTVLSVLETFNPSLKNAHINLAATYTNRFVEAALKAGK